MRNPTGLIRNIPALLAITWCYLPAARAQVPDSLDCTVEAYEGTLFADIYTDASAVSGTLCDAFKAQIGTGSSDPAYLEAVLKDFAVDARNTLDAKGLDAAGDYHAQFDGVIAEFSDLNVRNLDLPEFTVQRPFGGELPWGQFMPLADTIPVFNISEQDLCGALAEGASCVDVFTDFSEAFNPYRSAYNNLYDNSALLDELSGRWDRFLEVSKSQTSIEVLLTTLANRKHFRKNHLVGPPPFQVIALHPDLVYDTIDAGTDGDSGAFGLAVEWIGINYWDWKVPLGISLASVYVDRAGVKDTGHGLQLHIDNQYSLGWARHGGDDSFYFNVDLLKFFQDKKAQYDKFLTQYF